MLSIVVKSNSYQDSVALMLLSKQLSNLPGVKKASVMMGTGANIDILRNTGFDDPRLDAAKPGDLIVAIDADDQDAIDQAAAKADELLSAGQSGSGGQQLPHTRSLGRSLEKLPGANLALVSIPGEYVGELVPDLLARGLHTMIFSDNVSVADEIALKELAEQQGLLVMGPDCGTSVLHQVPLAFANVVRPGGVGIAGASGTGTQEVMCQVDRLGGGCSNVIGLGGRDLSEAVGGRSAIAALKALDADPATSVIVLVSKPPAPAVRDRVEQVAAGLSKPVIALFLGERPSESVRGNLHFVHTCDQAAELAVELDGSYGNGLTPTQRGIVGLFTGGTLASEAAMLIAEDFDLELPHDHPKGVMLDAGGHKVIDLGDDEYTRGRPHPMIDPSSRADQVPAVFDDPNLGVILIDVVLGYGSGPDPAGAIAEPIAAGIARCAEQGRTVHAVASICGTAGDPQDFDAQRQILLDAGIHVLPSNAAAVQHAIALVRAADAEHPAPAPVPEPTSELLAQGPAVINIGLASFTEPIAASGAPVVQYDWRPIAGGDRRLASLVRQLLTV